MRNLIENPIGFAPITTSSPADISAEPNRSTTRRRLLPPSLVSLASGIALVLSGCRGNPPETPTPNLPLPTPTVCNPDTFVQEHKIPTPIAVGGGENVPEDIVGLREKIDSCQTLTEAEQNRLIAFNIRVLEQKAAAEATMTVESQRPTPTPEVKKEVPCVILPTEYCSRAEIIKLRGSTYEVTYVVVNLPGGVPIRTPFGGIQEKGHSGGLDNPYSVTGGVRTNPDITRNPEDRVFSVVGDIVYNVPTERRIEEGNVVAVTANPPDPEKNAQGHTVAISIIRLIPGKMWVSDDALLRKHFPELFPAQK